MLLCVSHLQQNYGNGNLTNAGVETWFGKAFGETAGRRVCRSGTVEWVKGCCKSKKDGT